MLTAVSLLAVSQPFGLMGQTTGPVLGSPSSGSKSIVQGRLARITFLPVFVGDRLEYRRLGDGTSVTTRVSLVEILGMSEVHIDRVFVQLEEPRRNQLKSLQQRIRQWTASRVIRDPGESIANAAARGSVSGEWHRFEVELAELLDPGLEFALAAELEFGVVASQGLSRWLTSSEAQTFLQADLQTLLALRTRLRRLAPKLRADIDALIHESLDHLRRELGDAVLFGDDPTQGNIDELGLPPLEVYIQQLFLATRQKQGQGSGQSWVRALNDGGLFMTDARGFLVSIPNAEWDLPARLMNQLARLPDEQLNRNKRLEVVRVVDGLMNEWISQYQNMNRVAEFFGNAELANSASLRQAHEVMIERFVERIAQLLSNELTEENREALRLQARKQALGYYGIPGVVLNAATPRVDRMRLRMKEELKFVDERARQVQTDLLTTLGDELEGPMRENWEVLFLPVERPIAVGLMLIDD